MPIDRRFMSPFRLRAILLAGAFSFISSSAVSGAQVIVDNTDSGFSVLYGSWSTFDASGQYGSDYLYKSTSNSVTGEVEWRPTLTEAGTYTVSVWYRSTGSGRPNNAHYTVQHAGGSDDVFINQQINGSQWVSLGSYDFSAGTSGRVTLTDQAQVNKNIVADAVKFETLGPPEPEFRGFWVDVFHEGMQNTSQVDTMISLALQGNYNAIVPEILAYHDTQYASHGAYWRSDIVPQSSVVTQNFDPLEYMVQQAHANGLEVHPWIVAFRVSTAWPPPGNAYLAARPHWLMVPSGSMGNVAPVGSSYTLDPGSPDVQEYLTSIVREVVTDYAVDGIHWDYIRYTQTDAGYPADTGYANSSLERFKRISGFSGTPSTGYGPWNDFRRRSITELIRRVRAEIPTITSNPRQPVRHTAAVITWAPASTNFHSTNPYALFCDWEDWAANGYLDATIPMAYFDEDGSYSGTYRDWVDNSVIWKYDRHTFIGPGIYLNSFANSLTQMQYARSAGADGFCTYSYGVTSDTGTPWTDWYPYIGGNLFTQPAPMPEMPWRDTATATEGTLFGQVTDSTSGLPVDNAAVDVVGLGTVLTDGNGYYVKTLIPATAGGTLYDLSATHIDYQTPSIGQATVIAGDVVRRDLVLGNGPEVIIQPQPEQVCPGSIASFSVSASGTGTILYQWTKNGSDLTDGGDIQGATTAALSVNNVDVTDVANYACRLTDDLGITLTIDAALTLNDATVVTLQPEAQNPDAGEDAIFNVAGTGEGTLSYQWQKEGIDLTNGGNISGATTATLTVQSVQEADEGSYQCVLSAGCGSVTSDPALLLTLRPPGDFDRDMDVDLDDYAFLQSCFSGSLIPQNDPDCQAARMDGDTDVDENDLVLFQGCVSGAGMPADFQCAN